MMDPSHQLTGIPERGSLPSGNLTSMVDDLFFTMKRIRQSRPWNRAKDMLHAVHLCRAINETGYKVFLEGRGRITGARAKHAHMGVLSNIPLIPVSIIDEAEKAVKKRNDILKAALAEYGENQLRLLLLRRMEEIKKGGASPTTGS